MRTMFGTVALTALSLVIDTGPSQAQTYPWCAIYNDTYGARNCGFVTFEQCLATVSGIGGFCGQNPMFQPGLETRPGRKVRRYPG